MTADNAENRLINYRPLFEFALGMMAGILLCANVSYPFNIILAALIALLGCALMCFKRKRSAVFALAVLFGLSMASAMLPAEFSSGEARVCGTVCEIEHRENNTCLVLSRVKLNGEPFNKRVRFSLASAFHAQLKIGDCIEADASVQKPSRRFSTYDERKVLLSKGIGCIAAADSLTVTGEHALPVAEFVHGIRSAVDERIKYAFGEDGGIFSALLIGVRDELSDERSEAYRASGTAHLLAISGFHMGIIVGAISLLIPKRRRLLRFIVILAFASAYCTVAAYTPGIVRAAVMTACILGANLLERRPDMLSSLSLASILILTVNPFQLYSLGFQFSFSAVFGIALFSNSISRKLHGIRIPDKLSSAAAVCLSATIGTAMLQLRYYSSVTPYSLLSNLIAVPAFSAVVILGFITTLVSFIVPPFAQFAAILPRAVLFAVENLLTLISKLPLASAEFSPPSAICCIVFAFLIFTASEYVLRPKRKRLELAIPLLILFTFSYFMGIINA
ncbi:MAG: ComEC/Rec2 family competence protein [Clostridia bacterium]|nr:ComEC/Rec2 family competence protein [Clostridia bacterium]